MNITLAVTAESHAADGDYLLRLRGNSMTDVGMRDGDYLTVEDADTATDGQIVVLMVDGAATVQRWPTDLEGARVVGLVVGMFRDLAHPSKERQS